VPDVSVLMDVGCRSGFSGRSRREHGAEANVTESSPNGARTRLPDRGVGTMPRVGGRRGMTGRLAGRVKRRSLHTTPIKSGPPLGK